MNIQDWFPLGWTGWISLLSKGLSRVFSNSTVQKHQDIMLKYYHHHFCRHMPSNPWCHPTISSSVIPFSSCPQSFPASGSFPMSRLSASGGKSIGASVSASVLPMNIQGWFPLGWTLRGLLQHHSSKASILWSSAFFIVQLLHPHMTAGKTVALTIQTFVGKMIISTF